MKQLKTFTLDDIRKWGPCKDPTTYGGEEGKSYTVLDVIDSDIKFEDKLWLLLRTDLISDRTMRLFAVWCYRQTLEWVKDTNPRSIEAANVAERFANGEATREELEVAYSAAWSAAWSSESARSARSAAWSAAWSAAESARSAAWSAAEAATESAIDPGARTAARDATKAAAQSAQQAKLREMIIDGLDTGDTVTE